jgi:hypothetical protein
VATIITTDDLPAALQSADLIDVMVDGANAKASRVAPCLAGEGEDAPTADQIAEAKLVLIGAVKRWAETGAGSYQSQTAGPFGVTVDTRQRTGFNLWPSEIEGLQEICRAAGSGGTGRAFEVDTMPSDAGVYGVDYWWSSPTDRASF